MDIALAYGADVNNKSKDGIQVFLKACETALENEDTCLQMLKKGADPNSKHEVSNNIYQNTPPPPPTRFNKILSNTYSDLDQILYCILNL